MFLANVFIKVGIGGAVLSNKVIIGGNYWTASRNLKGSCEHRFARSGRGADYKVLTTSPVFFNPLKGYNLNVTRGPSASV